MNSNQLRGGMQAMKTDTPRTDALHENRVCRDPNSQYFMTVDLARTLERELTAMTAQKDELLKSLEEIIPYAEKYCDEGPDGGGWKSEPLAVKILLAQDAIAKAKGGENGND